MRALVAGRLRLTRRDSGAERRVLSGSALFLLSIAGACLTGLLAQVHVRLPLGVTPVPFTGQVLGVLICGAFLGSGEFQPIASSGENCRHTCVSGPAPHTPVGNANGGNASGMERHCENANAKTPLLELLHPNR